MIRKILMSAMMVLLIFAAGCDSNNPPEENNKPTKQETVQTDEQKNSPQDKENNSAVKNSESKTGKEKVLKVKIYYPDDAGMKLVGVNREIKIAKDDDKYLATVKLLLDAPKEKNLTRIFPGHAKIISVLLKGDTALVNFDGKLAENFVGGSTGEEMLVNSVVNTLTEFPEVKQVKFLLDGKDIETLSGHMDLSSPLKRTEE